MTNTNQEDVCDCGHQRGSHTYSETLCRCGCPRFAQPTLRDRLALVNVGDMLTVEDTRGDTWTGIVRDDPCFADRLRWGPGLGFVLRFGLNPGKTVEDIRDHVPAVIATPEPANVGAVIRDAEGVVGERKSFADACCWALTANYSYQDYGEFTQPVTVLFEGVTP